MIRVKNLITSHDRHQILRLGQIDDIVRPAGNHVNCFDFVSGNFKLYRLAGIDVALLNQAVTWPLQ